MRQFDQTFGVYSGLVFVTLLGIAMIMAGFLPPPPPSLSNDEVAALYQSRAGLVRAAMIIAMLGMVFIPPFVAVITTQMRRMEGISRMLPDLQVAVGCAAILALLVPVMLFAITAFRPERDPAITATLHDAAWLFFIAPFSLAVAQNMTIGLATLLDTAKQPVFPRWVGYFNLWTALLFMPGGIAVALKTGPFAWNGILSFWIAASAFFAWFIVMTIVLLRALRSDDGSKTR